MEVLVDFCYRKTAPQFFLGIGNRKLSLEALIVILAVQNAVLLVLALRGSTYPCQHCKSEAGRIYSQKNEYKFM